MAPRPTPEQLAKLIAAVPQGVRVELGDGIVIDKRPLAPVVASGYYYPYQQWPTNSPGNTNAAYMCPTCHSWITFGTTHSCGGSSGTVTRIGA